MALPLGDKFMRRLVIAGMEHSDNTLENSLHTVNVSSVIRGAPGWRGVSQIDSGLTSVVVSAAAVQSGSPVLFTPHQGATMTDSGQGIVLAVDSVVDNQSFMAVTGGSIAPTDNYPFTYVIMR